MRHLRLLAATAVLVTLLSGAAGGSSATLPGLDWARYTGDATGRGFTPETIISPTTAPSLRAPTGWPVQVGPMATQPIVANGLVYTGSFNGNEYAVPAVGSSQHAWTTYLGMTDAGDCGTSGIASSAAVASITLPGTSAPKSLLFVGGGGTDSTGGGEARLYALDALTGAVVWETPLGAAPATYMWSSPLVYSYDDGAGVKTSVYVGVSSFGDCPLVQGRVVQLDAATGQIEHAFNLVPDGCVGGSAWGSAAIDTTDDSLYIATGNGGQCHTIEPFSEALVKLNAKNLALVDAWQVPKAERVFDSDFGSVPTVFDGTITPGGEKRPLVGVVNKNGTFYVFDRGYVGHGPVARLPIADPGSDPEDGEGSVAPAAYDGHAVYVAGGKTTIDGTAYSGSIRALNPDDLDHPFWEHGFTEGPVLAAVTAAPGIVSVGAGPVTYVLDSSNGNVLFRAPDASAGSNEPAPLWGAPSISHGTLYEGDLNGLLYAYTDLLQVTTTSLPSAHSGQRYATHVTALGGQPGYSWTAKGLPTGLSLSRSGVIGGTTRASGKFNITFSVRDAANPQQQAAARLLLTVTAASSDRLRTTSRH